MTATSDIPTARGARRALKSCRDRTVPSGWSGYRKERYWVRRHGAMLVL